MHLFDHFLNVATQIGVYMTSYYISVLEHLDSFWNVDKIEGEGGP